MDYNGIILQVVCFIAIIVMLFKRRDNKTEMKRSLMLFISILVILLILSIFMSLIGG
jgi:hypothetical protein